MNKKENTKKKVFVVSSGAGEDYFVAAMFSTKEEALEYLDWMDDFYQLEEWELDEPYERKPHLYSILFNVKEDKITARIACGSPFDVYKGTICYMSGQFSVFIESDSKKRAIEQAKEIVRDALENEQTKFPYLRVKVIGNYGNPSTPYFDYKTGEMLVAEGEEILIDLPDFVKVRNIKK